MSGREIREKYQAKQSKKTGKGEHFELSSKKELASRKTLKSCEIFLKAIFLAECVDDTINVWTIDDSYFHELANTSWTHLSCV